MAKLADVAARGVHHVGERPFLTPWTEGTPKERAEHVLRNHWGCLAEVFQDNHASQGVSRRLGYQPDGISRDPRDGEVLVSDRLRLTSTRWMNVERVSVTVEGLDAARSMFG